MSQTEWLTRVSPTDQVLGKIEKYQAHRENILHRAISVWLFRQRAGKLETLIQQRSNQKIVGAGLWANTVCGNVWYQESYLDCAQRRLQDELAITGVELQPIQKFVYRSQTNSEFGEHEVDQVFGGWYNGKVQPNPAEAQDYKWIEFQPFWNWFQQLDFPFSADAQGVWVVNNGQIPPQPSYQSLSIASWTVIMAKVVDVKGWLGKTQN